MSQYFIGEIGLQGNKMVEVSIECTDPLPDDSESSFWDCLTRPVAVVVQWIKDGSEVKVGNPFGKSSAVAVVALADGAETLWTVQTGQPDALQMHGLHTCQVNERTKANA